MHLNGLQFNFKQIATQTTANCTIFKFKAILKHSIWHSRLCPRLTISMQKHSSPMLSFYARRITFRPKIDLQAIFANILSRNLDHNKYKKLIYIFISQ